MGNESLHVVWTQKKNTQTALISSPTSCQSAKDRTALLWALVGLKDKSKAQLSPAPHQALYFYVKGAWTEPTVRRAIIKHDGTRRAENIWPWWMGAGCTSKPPPPLFCTGEAFLWSPAGAVCCASSDQSHTWGIILAVSIVILSAMF